MDTHLLGVIAGFLVVLLAAGLSFSQKKLEMTHVVVFAIGGVLAGISTISFTGKDTSVVIGQVTQVAKATDVQNQALAAVGSDVGKLAQDTSTQLKAINTRLDGLSSAVDILKTSAVAARPEAQGAAAQVNDILKSDRTSSSVFDQHSMQLGQSLIANSARFNALVARSRTLTAAAQTNAPAKPPGA